MYQRHETGRTGEEAACNFLEKNGYDIKDRNFSCSQGEIDIVAWDDIKKELVFIEVKTRTSRIFGNPVDAVDMKKQKHIYWAAQYYIYLHSIKDLYIRFDVIEVYVGTNKTIINHIKQIF